MKAWASHRRPGMLQQIFTVLTCDANWVAVVPGASSHCFARANYVHSFPTPLVKTCRRFAFDPWIGKILRRREWLPILACSILAWRIPWTEEPSRLHSMGSQRVGHDWTTFTSLLNSDLILYIGCLNLATVGVSTPLKMANATNQCFSLREVLKYLPAGH